VLSTRPRQFISCCATDLSIAEKSCVISGNLIFKRRRVALKTRAEKQCYNLVTLPLSYRQNPALKSDKLLMTPTAQTAGGTQRSSRHGSGTVVGELGLFRLGTAANQTKRIRRGSGLLPVHGACSCRAGRQQKQDHPDDFLIRAVIQDAPELFFANPNGIPDQSPRLSRIGGTTLGHRSKRIQPQRGCGERRAASGNGIAATALRLEMCWDRDPG